jgi:hypothetical protein
VLFSNVMRMRFVFILAFAWVASSFAAACSSGSGSPPSGTGGAAGGGTGGGSASGGTGGCPQECFAPSQCVHACGETPVDYGCCGCPAGMIDSYQCVQDAGCNPVVGSPADITCGATTCSATQICVQPCCGGEATDGSACKPAPPYCVDAATVECTPCNGNQCQEPQGCSGMLDGQWLGCLCA